MNAHRARSLPADHLRWLNDLDPLWYRPAAPRRLTGAPNDPLLTCNEV
ncbi:hypothetical protein [Mycobacterium nebraskense]|nr:hypothetical protein [Mycobacterium nebraskense]